MSQNATSSWGGNRKSSYAFTEQGVAMLSGVLRSETAIAVSIQIMNAFVQMRHFLQNNAEIFVELKSIRKHQIESDIHQKEADKRIDELFDKMDKYAIDDRQGIFFQGQIFDAYAKLSAMDIQKFNAQYPSLTVDYTTKMHDRFLIIDNQTLYHIGASLKDLGKKCFAFEVLESALIPSVLKNL